MEGLYLYDWPGNVREMEHVLERAFILSESDTIIKEEIQRVIYSTGELPAQKENVVCINLMPLKAAKYEVEKQLLTRAYQIYKSTYKMAEALQIDQSTVVKLLHKHGEGKLK